MKNTIFKIAGVKNEKEFYSKYPTEESFMAKHGATFKKAQWGNMSGMVKEASTAGGGATGGGGGGFMKNIGGVEGIGQTIGSITSGFRQLRAARRARKDAQQFAEVSDVGADAAESIDVDARRQQSDIMQDRYNTQMRPINGEELFPVDGVGTNVLAKYGSIVKAQNGEQFSPIELNEVNIQADDSLWKERFNDKFNEGMKSWRQQKTGVSPNYRFSQSSPEYIQAKDSIQNSIYKEIPRGNVSDPEIYKYGGYKAQNGFSKFMKTADGQNVGQMAGSMAGNIMGNDPGSQIGGAIGGGIGSAFGPGGKEIGTILGKVGGGLLDRNKEKTEAFQNTAKKNMQRMGVAGMSNSIHGMNSGYMQHGGEISAQGDIQPLWGGGLEPISSNPYTDGNQTMMFKGNSHKEGGIGIDYAGNKIEAERGEPAMKMQQGGEAEGLVIFGDLPISKQTAEMLGDPEAKGKKFKKYVENITDKETKVNKRKTKSAEIATDLKPINKFDRLKLGTQAIISKGADNKLKAFAEKKENAALAQNAINETAEELGANPKLIAIGGDKLEKWIKRKMNKKDKFVGGSPKSVYAQDGKTVYGSDSRFMTPIEEPYQLEEPYQFGGNEDYSGLGPVAVGNEPTYKIDGTKYASRRAFLDKFNNMKNIDTANVEISNDDGFNDEIQQELRNTTVVSPIENKTNASKTNASKSSSRTVTGKKGMGDVDGVAKKAFGRQSRNADGTYGRANFEEFKARNPWYDWEGFDPKKRGDVMKLQESINARTKGDAITVDGKFGDQTFSYTEGPGLESQGLIKLDATSDAKIDPNRKASLPDTDKPEKNGFDPMPYLNAIAPLFGKGSDAEGLDGNQLWGEMAALSNNKVEPVYAQSYKPELDVPYDISLQDQRNQVTSSIRAAQKLGQGNPASQAMLQSQEYEQTQPINANEFRLNQGKKDQVYSGNRSELNDAKQKNIGIFDQQAERQSTARSNTKEATQLALNSISSKYQQNKLEQRTLKTYENMYNYRFGENYRARNVNDPADFKAMWKASQMGGTGGTGTGASAGTDQPATSTPGYNPGAQYSKYGGTITRTLKKF